MKIPAIRFVIPARALMVALALMLAAPCHAEDADKDKPINFSSDTGGASNATGSGELNGHVTITQGTLVLHADRITFKQNPDNSLSVTAYGNPVSYRQKSQGSDEYDEAYAQRIVYDGQKQIVELFDHALLKQGPTKELRSDYISYDRVHGIASAGTVAGASTPDKPATRVTGVILPKDINAAEKAKDTKPGDAKPKDDKAPGAPSKDDKATDARSKDAKPDAANAGAAKTPAPAPNADAAKPAAPAPLPLTIDSELKSK
jgi:lipopolysaccharide export system protein LptA